MCFASPSRTVPAVDPYRFSIRAVHGPSLYGEETVLVLALSGAPAFLETPASDTTRRAWRDLLRQLGPGDPGDLPAGVTRALLVAATLERLTAWARGRPPVTVRSFRFADRIDAVCAEAPRQIARSAAELAFRLVTVASGEVVPGAEDSVAPLRAGAADLRKLAETVGAGPDPDSALIRDACRAAGISWRPSLVFPGTTVAGEGAALVRFSGSCPLVASSLGTLLTREKATTKTYLGAFGLPVVPHGVAASEDAARAIAAGLRYPVVLKPTNGSGGRGLTLDVRDETELAAAFAEARANGPSVMVERYVDAGDYRAFVVGGRVPLVFRRNPPYVVGDGEASIAALIAAHNDRVAAGTQLFPSKKEVAIDADIHRTLARSGLTLDSVPAAGERIVVRTIPLRSRGGWLEAVTDRVHPATIRIFERAAALTDLPVVALDFRAEAIERPWDRQSFAILELNARPTLTDLDGERVAARIVASLFPAPAAWRLPVVLVVDDGPADPSLISRRIAVRAALDAAIAGAVVAGPEGVWMAGAQAMPAQPAIAVAQARIVEDPTARVALHWTRSADIAQYGLGLAVVDRAFLDPRSAAGPVDALVRRVARRVEPLPDAASLEKTVVGAVTELAGAGGRADGARRAAG